MLNASTERFMLTEHAPACCAAIRNFATHGVVWKPGLDMPKHGLDRVDGILDDATARADDPEVHFPGNRVCMRHYAELSAPDRARILGRYLATRARRALANRRW